MSFSEWLTREIGTCIRTCRKTAKGTFFGLGAGADLVRSVDVTEARDSDGIDVQAGKDRSMMFPSR
jgi:hypothetical protein